MLPMVVHSAEPPEYLRQGLSDMIVSRLERIPELEVVRLDATKSATTNLAKAIEIARENKAEFVLFGSFTRFGTGASLDVQCAATANKEGEEPLREIFVHSGSIGDVIPDLDDLVGKVARFVVADYSDRTKGTAAAGSGAAGAPNARAIQQLEDRVGALEAALDKLNAQLGAKPADVAVSP